MEIKITVSEKNLPVTHTIPILSFSNEYDPFCDNFGMKCITNIIRQEGYRFCFTEGAENKKLDCDLKGINKLIETLTNEVKDEQYCKTQEAEDKIKAALLTLIIICACFLDLTHGFDTYWYCWDIIAPLCDDVETTINNFDRYEFKLIIEI